MLYILAGLPGTGKTTLARQLARTRKAVHLRVDTIEQALRDSGLTIAGPEGYDIAYRIAADNLRLGLDVVADTVNPIRITRDAWRSVAIDAGVSFVDIEIICSDPAEHRARVEGRVADIRGHVQPTWAEVESRQYEPWDHPPITIDTAGKTIEESIAELDETMAR